MKWYNCYNSTRWGVEISNRGEVEQINYERGDDKRAFSGKDLNDEVIMDAFESIIRSSDEGTYYLAHNVKGSAANILSSFAQFEIDRSDAIIQALKANH